MSHYKPILRWLEPQESNSVTQWDVNMADYPLLLTRETVSYSICTYAKTHSIFSFVGITLYIPCEQWMAQFSVIFSLPLFSQLFKMMTTGLPSDTMFIFGIRCCSSRNKYKWLWFRRTVLTFNISQRRWAESEYRNAFFTSRLCYGSTAICLCGHLNGIYSRLYIAFVTSGANDPGNTIYLSARHCV